MTEPIAPCALVLTTQADWAATPALAAEVARRAGLPVRGVQAITPRMFAVTLDAASAASCEQATARLAADKAFAVSVEADRRRTRPVRPSASSAQ